MTEPAVTRSRDGAVAILIMQRPEAANAFDARLRTELAAALRDVGRDPQVRAVVLGGAGRIFCAGADLREAPPVDVEAQVLGEYWPLFAEIILAPKPVISAVGGVATGIGLSLALACDLTVIADDAVLIAPFSQIGLVPDGGASWLLARQLGYKRAFQLAVEAERIPAARALEWGLVNRVEPRHCLLERTVEWAQSLAQRSAAALAATKTAMRYAVDRDYRATFELEAKLQARCAAGPDFREGVKAFLEKRKPEFSAAAEPSLP